MSVLCDVREKMLLDYLKLRKRSSRGTIRAGRLPLRIALDTEEYRELITELRNCSVDGGRYILRRESMRATTTNDETLNAFGDCVYVNCPEPVNEHFYSHPVYHNNTTRLRCTREPMEAAGISAWAMFEAVQPPVLGSLGLAYPVASVEGASAVAAARLTWYNARVEEDRELPATLGPGAMARYNANARELGARMEEAHAAENVALLLRAAALASHDRFVAEAAAHLPTPNPVLVGTSRAAF